MNTVVAICLLVCVSLAHGTRYSNLAESNEYEVFARNLLQRLLEEETRESGDREGVWGDKRGETLDSDLLKEETRFASELESLEQAIETTKRAWKNAGEECMTSKGAACTSIGGRCCKSSTTSMAQCKKDTGCCITSSYTRTYNNCAA